MKNKNKNKIK